MPSTASSEGSTPTVGALPLAERQIPALECSIAAFAGLAPAGPLDRAVRVESFEAFAAAFSDPEQPRHGPFVAGASLAPAVRGFFRNGGRTCWVARAGAKPATASVSGHLAALRLLVALDEPSVVAAPDAHATATGADGARTIQRELIASCERVVGRIALVDPPPGLDPDGALAWRSSSRIDSPAAAAYYPWIESVDPATGTTVEIAPCGHVAGLWARVDGEAGLHCAPTAEALFGAEGTPVALTGPQQHHLNRAGLNCLRAWPGPELRVWGACTMSSDPDLRYLHRQRLVGHLAASIAQGTRWAADDPAVERIHESLRATVTSFLNGAWRDGALRGDTAAQAFFVHCDPGHDDARARALGEIVVEIGLAVRRPCDFRVLRISHHASVAA
ncbi:MAG TPA: phage tail sheath subtilisin-like domain-containing protein [Solirubrobacteraceae bacterium]|jgi:phage tail sheath protein FI